MLNTKPAEGSPGPVSFDEMKSAPEAPAPEPVPSTESESESLSIEEAPPEEISSIVKEAVKEAAGSGGDKAPGEGKEKADDPAEPQGDDALTGLLSELSTPGEEEPGAETPSNEEERPSPQAEYRLQAAMNKAGGDPKKAAQILAAEIESAASERQKALDQLVAAKGVLEDKYQPLQDSPELRQDVAGRLATFFKKRHAETVDARAEGLLKAPGGVYSDGSWRKEDVVNALNSQFTYELKQRIEDVLPDYVDQEIKAHNEKRSEAINPFDDLVSKRAEEQKAERIQKARELDERVNALGPAIGDDPLLRHMTLLEMNAAEDGADDKAVLSSAKQKLFASLGSSLPSAYESNPSIKEIAKKIVFADPDVVSKLQKWAASQKSVAPAKTIQAEYDPTELSRKTQPTGWGGHRPEGQAASVQYTFEEAKKDFDPNRGR